MIDIILIILCAGAAIVLVANMVISEYLRKQDAKTRLGLAMEQKIDGAALFNVLRAPIGDLSRRLRSIEWAAYEKVGARWLAMAGLKDRMNIQELFAFQIFMAVLFLLGWGSFLLGTGLAPAGWGGRLFCAVLLISLGGGYPWLWIKMRVKSRHQEIRLSLGPAVDLISVSVEAGLDFIAAIKRVVDRTKSNPLTEEMKQLTHEIQIGSTREQALRSLADRIGEPSINSFTAVLIQADRLGTSIGPALKAQAMKMRTERFQAAERLGAAASQKIIFPLVFFIMPAVFIVIFSPIVLHFLRGGLGEVF